MPIITDKPEMARIAGTFEFPYLSRFAAAAQGMEECFASSSAPRNPVHVVRFGYRAFVRPPEGRKDAAAAAEVFRHIEKEIRSQSGQDFDVMSISSTDSSFFRLLRAAYKQKEPAVEWRDTFFLDVASGAAPNPVPAGYELIVVDSALFKRALKNSELMAEHILSERTSMDDFHRRGFGICALKGRELAGWCISGHESGTGCEIGIDVRQDHRKRGLASALLCRFAEEANRRGLKSLFFDCHRQNAPAWQAAFKAGFSIKVTYPTLLICKDRSLQYGANGNIAMRDGDGDAALEWYKRAAATGNAPFWVFINMAQVQAITGDIELVRQAYEGLKGARME